MPIEKTKEASTSKNKCLKFFCLETNAWTRTPAHQINAVIKMPHKVFNFCIDKIPQTKVCIITLWGISIHAASMHKGAKGLSSYRSCFNIMMRLVTVTAAIADNHNFQLKMEIKWNGWEWKQLSMIIAEIMDITTMLILCSQYIAFLMQKLCRKRLPP